MTKRERVQAVIQGKQPDQVPVSFWHHFDPAEMTGQPAVDAHLRVFETYDLDFIKAMNDHPFPRGGDDALRSVDDLKKIRPVPGDAEGFAGQLDVLRNLRERVGRDVPICTTMFNAWTTLRNMTAPPKRKHGPPTLGEATEKDESLSALLKEDRSAFKAALDAVAESLANFARTCLEAGADGVFLSVRDDWVDTPANGDGTYDELVKPADLKVLDASSSGTFNVLHACGAPKDFKRFASYPAHVINWADRAAGPTIAYARDRAKPAIAAGVDNLKTMPDGSPEDCAEQVRDALRQAKDRPILVTPGCTFDPAKVPAENLKAIVAAARGSG